MRLTYRPLRSCLMSPVDHGARVPPAWLRARAGVLARFGVVGAPESSSTSACSTHLRAGPARSRRCGRGKRRQGRDGQGHRDRRCRSCSRGSRTGGGPSRARRRHRPAKELAALRRRQCSRDRGGGGRSALDAPRLRVDVLAGRQRLVARRNRPGHDRALHRIHCLRLRSRSRVGDDEDAAGLEDRLAAALAPTRRRESAVRDDRVEVDHLRHSLQEHREHGGRALRQFEAAAVGGHEVPGEREAQARALAGGHRAFENARREVLRNALALVAAPRSRSRDWAPDSRATTVVVPPPWCSEFSMSVASTCDKPAGRREDGGVGVAAMSSLLPALAKAAPTRRAAARRRPQHHQFGAGAQRPPGATQELVDDADEPLDLFERGLGLYPHLVLSGRGAEISSSRMRQRGQWCPQLV